MRKQLLAETPDLELDDEQLTAEMLELTCDEVDALTRAFNMIAEMCEELQQEVAEDSNLDIPENLVN